MHTNFLVIVAGKNKGEKQHSKSVFSLHLTTLKGFMKALYVLDINNTVEAS